MTRHSCDPLSVRQHLVSIAPMMDWTDRHYRYMMRLLTRRTLLYTEMVTTGAIMHGDRDYLLGYDPTEHPISLQLGGDDPQMLAECARIAEDLGYDEVNLNVGCPSDRVQRGRFGACLMAEPEVVRRCVEGMKGAVGIPVTVKHRIGIDDRDSYDDMLHFVEEVAKGGADRFTIHARKAWLQGLSPKANRNVPPLRYDDVYALKCAHPELVVEVNGGVTELKEVEQHLCRVDAVMVGRAAYYNPSMFLSVDSMIYGDPPIENTRDHFDSVMQKMYEYAGRWLHDDNTGRRRLSHITRHMLHLFDGRPGSRGYRRMLSERGAKSDAPPDLILDAYKLVRWDD